jgi:hypothetical protein
MENLDSQTKVATPEVITQPTSAKDIIARMGVEPPKPVESNVPEAPKLDDIKDPVARAVVEKRLKEFESGYNKKYEDLANKRKEFESKMSQQEIWDQEKLDRALKDPTFVSLVQARQQQASAHQAPSTWEGSSDEWSSLTAEEKQQFVQLNSRLSAQEQIMSNMLKTEEDSKLKQSYPDYDPKLVDQVQQDLLSGRLQATREHLWKVANFETAVERAYKLGLQDRKLELNDKLNASTTPSNRNVTPANEVPEDVKKQGFGAIGRWRLNQLKGVGR